MIEDFFFISTQNTPKKFSWKILGYFVYSVCS